MQVRNWTKRSNTEFLADSIRCWQEALERGDTAAFEYWAVHCCCFARGLVCPSSSR